MSEPDGLATLKMAELASIEYTEADGALRTQDLLEALFVEFSGPVGIAKQLYIEFSAANRGSQTRVKILDNIMRLVEKFDTGSQGSNESIDNDQVDQIEQELKRQNEQTAAS